jgi:hypothetical protein
VEYFVAYLGVYTALAYLVLVLDCCLFHRLGIEDGGDACSLEQSNLGKRCLSYFSVSSSKVLSFTYILLNYGKVSL